MTTLLEGIWQYATQDVAPPTAGTFRTSPTEGHLWIHSLDDSGYDRTIEFEEAPTPPFRVLARDTLGHTRLWEATGITRIDDYYELPAVFVEGSTEPLPKNTEVLMQWFSGEVAPGPEPDSPWYISIDQIRLLFPGISDAEAARLQELVTLAINAVTCEEIPTDPVPDAVQFAAMLWVGQMYGAAPGGGALMSSERIGDYSYTLTGGATLEDSMSKVPVDVATYLGPWLCAGVTEANAFQLTVWPPPSWSETGWVGSTFGWLPPSERAD